MTENLELNISLDSPLPSVFDAKHTDFFVKKVLNDYETCVLSREMSVLGRREVLTGKAKFGIFGDGKEVPQVALAQVCKKGDWRSGYYRDQTWMLATNVSSPEEFFAQLYADSENDPFSGGRQMDAHYATPMLDKSTGEWTNHREIFNVTSDISSTAGQMARAVGLALASKKYREIIELRHATTFSDNGNEVVFCSIGDGSCAEGPFWESVNAASVLRIPLAIFIWDDGYGISVPAKFQLTKSNISEILRGFELDENGEGIDIYTCKAWDYASMVELFDEGIEKVRRTHIPAIFHVQDVTQPQGHSTSGSHERYKTAERLEWERHYDCNIVMRKWILESELATEKQLETIEVRAKAHAREARNRAWNVYHTPLKEVKAQLEKTFEQLIADFGEQNEGLKHLFVDIKNMREPFLSEMVKNARQAAFILRRYETEAISDLKRFIEQSKQTAEQRYSTHLYSETRYSALKVPVVPPVYATEPHLKSGYEIINAYFDLAFEKYPNTFAFGEDVGHIGDVNQGFMGLQAKYGIERIFDTGIREWTIMGQAIGMAMRGLRPIAEIQYLDYVYYALAPLADDLSSLRYRSNGIQRAPAIIRTRGHRLEGIWHAGSPMGMMLHALRGIYLCVPRNFVQAAGMYATLLQSDDPAIVVECLNGYRLKENMPSNLGSFTVPLGVPEVLTEGSDVTLVTYGSCARVALEAIEILKKMNISVELIDIQTLIPFDTQHMIVESLKKTNRIIFFDEDVPGGATSYMMQEVLEKQNGYAYLDAKPRTISAKEHRPPYGSDGDYFSKPSAEDVIDAVLELLGD